MLTELPEYDACERAVQAGIATPLEKLIQGFEPTEDTGGPEFRQAVWDLIIHLQVYSKGVEEINAERMEQITKHNRSLVYDVRVNTNAQLSFAAALLSCPVPASMGCSAANNYSCPEGWDFKIWEKIIKKPYRARLIIAGAFIAAEIDRLDEVERRRYKN